MNIRTIYTFTFAFALGSTLLLSISAAQAYIGPGLGVVAIWGLLGPIAGVISLVLLIAYFPLRYYYKKRRHNKNKKNALTEGNETARKDSDDEGKSG